MSQEFLHCRCLLGAAVSVSAIRARMVAAQNFERKTFEQSHGRITLTPPGLGHELLHGHPVNCRLPVTVALERQSLAVRREHRSHHAGIASLMFGQSELSLYSPCQQ